MYAVVEYNDYRKEQSFEIIITTDDVEYAKKVAFQNAKKQIPENNCNDSCNLITTKMENEYLLCKNKTVVVYKIINVEKYKKKLNYSFSMLYAVIELTKKEIIVEEINTDLICDNYKDYDSESYSESDSDESEMVVKLQCALCKICVNFDKVVFRPDLFENASNFQNCEICETCDKKN